MNVNWNNRPGHRNAPYEIDHGWSGEYYFSLCRTKDKDDPYAFRVWVYGPRGYMPVRPADKLNVVGVGYQSIDDARAAVKDWQVPAEQTDTD